MFLDYFYLLLLAASFLLLLYIRWNSKHFFNSGNLVLLMYTLCSITSIHLYSLSNQTYWGLNPFALLFMFLVIAGLTYPLYRICKAKGIILLPQKYVVILCILLIAFSLWNSWNQVANMSQGFARLMIDDEYGAQLYSSMILDNTNLSGGTHTHNYLSILTNMARKFVVFFLFYYLLYPQRNTYIVFLLVIASIFGIIENVVIGSRHGILANLIVMVLTALTFYNFYEHKLRRKIRLFGISIVTIVMMGFTAITISRAYVGNQDTGLFVESYIGQNVLNMGKYGFDNGGIRYGDRTIPWFKSWFTSDVAATYFERINKYSNLKIDESVFISFVGDFALDFGPLGSFLILVFVMIFFSGGLSRVSKLRIHHLMAAYLLIHIVGGFNNYFLADNGGNLTFFLMLLSIIILYYLSRNMSSSDIICQNSSIS